MANIQQSYNWAIETCNAENVGYSQTYREQQTVNGITYYDCSSFIWYALLAGGFDVLAHHANYAFTTRDMCGVLEQLGFVKHSTAQPWVAGDILWRRGHTEMAFDKDHSMGAHTSNVPLAQQVSINANPSSANDWTELWRYEQGAKTEWIKGNRWLSIGEMQNNANIIYSYLLSKGWSTNAISAMLGNMQTESTVNPAIWQGLKVNPNLGYGLVQWTPSTNFTNWAQENGYQIDDGNAQLIWIDEVTTQVSQWIPTAKYPLTFEEFKVSTETPEYLADAFLKNFERPEQIEQPDRMTQARYWYEWYNGQPVPPPNSGGEGDWKSKMPIWLMLKQL